MKFSIYTFTILLCATLFVAGCKKDNKSNNANTKPKADFTYVISSAVIPDSITFTNTSQGGITYKWQLWDGNTSQSATGFSELISAVPLVPLTVKLIATNNFGSDTVTKTISLASTLITSLPTNALPNSAVTIGGINFGTANNQILLNGVSATVLSSTTTTITFVVPANATSGKMTVNTNGVSIAVNFKVYAPSISAAFPTKYYLKHISYYDWTYTAAATNFLTELYGVNETDSIFFDTHSRMGGGAQYVSNLTGFSIPLGTTIKFLGVTTGYAVGNDYRIYTAGTGVNNFNAGFFAGSGVSGFADGQGAAAQFVAPYAIATYPSTAADVYVTDSHRIRKITAGGLVSTLAGSGADGNADGQGTAATFGDLSGITVDPASGNIYVTDTKYRNIRKITPSGAVTTFAGSGTAGFNDGQGTAAQFFYPKAISIDGQGNLFITDSNYNTAGPFTSTVRMINPLGNVTTVLSSAKGDAIINPDGIACGPTGFYVCNTGSATQPLIFVSFVAK